MSSLCKDANVKYSYENTRNGFKFIIYRNTIHVEANKASGHVMEKCGLHFVRYGEFEKLDGSCKARSMEYEGELFKGIDDQR